MSSTLSALIQRPVIESVKLTDRFGADSLSRYRGRRIYQYNAISLLELADLPEILADSTDRQEPIPSGEAFRPDLTSRRYYVTPYLWWVLLRANGIRDPFVEYVSGKTIRIPTQVRVFATVLNG